MKIFDTILTRYYFGLRLKGNLLYSALSKMFVFGFLVLCQKKNWLNQFSKKNLSLLIDKSHSNLLYLYILDRGHSQRMSGTMLDLFPPSLLVRNCPNLVTPFPLGYPACFKNVCNLRFVIITISLILLKNTFGKFFIIGINETVINKIFKRQNIPYNVSTIHLLHKNKYITYVFCSCFFLTRTSGLLSKTPLPMCECIRISANHPSTLDSDVNGTLKVTHKVTVSNRS